VLRGIACRRVASHVIAWRHVASHGVAWRLVVSRDAKFIARVNRPLLTPAFLARQCENNLRGVMLKTECCCSVGVAWGSPCEKCDRSVDCKECPQGFQFLEKTIKKVLFNNAGMPSLASKIQKAFILPTCVFFSVITYKS
jgi:hypothetical protein